MRTRYLPREINCGFATAEEITDSFIIDNMLADPCLFIDRQRCAFNDTYSPEWGAATYREVLRGWVF